MTSNDVRDILELHSKHLNSTDNLTPSKKANKPEKEKKPDGIPRELFQLIGGPPPIAFVKPAFKAKPNLRKKAVHWEWQSFTNQGRGEDDQLTLHHWVKCTPTSESEDSGYWFAEYNKKIDILKYDDEEYEKYLTDKDWTKEETDYLFKLCDNYDLRFTVIHDRYEYKERSMEDLKDRYYSVCKKLLQVRPPEGSDKGALIAMNTYDKAKEEKRKKHMCALYLRSPEEIKEEEALLEEYERIEQNEKKFAKERENLLKLLSFQELAQPKRKKSLLSGPTTPTMEVGNSNFHTSTEIPKKNRRTSASSVGSAVIEAEVHNAPITARKEKFPQGVVVRSSKIPLPKQTMILKVQKTLQEFGLGIDMINYICGPRPSIPTETVCARWVDLQKAIQTLLDVKKAVEKADHELKAKKVLLQKIKQNGLGSASKSANSGDAGGKQSDVTASVSGDGGGGDESSVVPTKRERITLTTTPRDAKRARK
ncbi:SWR1-complex protein 4 [Gigaspora margarita]|uniref:SWR1-complex protein 4 n=1 Tax=Gigaspora margarita TaxID=4874 RepID=A0A8H4A8I7_GIGMA|nr:SWR1-complex protein 4 [Gigaspora margarita]